MTLVYATNKTISDKKLVLPETFIRAPRLKCFTQRDCRQKFVLEKYFTKVSNNVAIDLISILPVST